MALPRYDGAVFDNVPRPVPGASIAVLTQPATTSTQPGSPLASIFADVNGATPLPNPFNAANAPSNFDGNGNYFFYAAAGVYTVQIYGGTLANQIVLADQSLGTAAPGIVLQHGGVANSSQTLLNVVAGTNMTSITEAAGAVTFNAAAAAVTFQTNGTNNGSQTTLNLAQGSGITVTNSGGTATIAATAAATFQVNGVNTSNQSTINFQSGSNVTVTNPSAGNVSIAATLPAFQVNATPTTSQTTINYQSGSNIQVTNPSAGNVAYNVFGTVIKAASVDLTAQTAPITTTNFPGGPFAAGQYLLCWNAKITTAGTSPVIGPLTIVYTDPDTVVQTITAGALSKAGAVETSDAGNSTTTVLLGIPLTLNVAASSNVSYAFALTGTVGAGQYNLHLRLEALPT